MKKEKWLLKEIEGWQAKEIVNEETALLLKSMYQPKKSIGLLMVLFSVIGSLLIGMGIVLVSANNWWYALPIFVRTFIGFLPLLLSQGVVLYVYRRKMGSTAFRESGALLNMAGVFASIAIVGQIFHLPGDFTNYLLICGVLSLASMLILDAVSPLIIYYWTTINGGVYFGEEIGIIISVVLFAIGAAFALHKCRKKQGTSLYVSFITMLAAFALILVSALKSDCDISFILYGYALLLLSAAPIFRACEEIFSAGGRLCFLVLTFVVTYQGLWNYEIEFDSLIFLFLTALLILLAAILFIKNLRDKRYDLFSVVAAGSLLIRVLWGVIGLTSSPFDVIFMILFNVMLFGLSIWCIFDGARKIDVYQANTGMIPLCILIMLRFFDSELSLAARGIVFLILGAGFLMFNLYLVKTKKRLQEETI